MPAFSLLVIDKQMSRDDPDVFATIHIDIISLVGLATIVLDETVFPHHLTLVTIEGHDHTVAGDDEHLVATIAKRRQPELLGNLIITITVFDQGQLLCLRIITIHTLIVSLHPETFLRIDEETVDTTLDTHLR